MLINNKTGITFVEREGYYVPVNLLHIKPEDYKKVGFKTVNKTNQSKLNLKVIGDEDDKQ